MRIDARLIRKIANTEEVEILQETLIELLTQQPPAVNKRVDPEKNDLLNEGWFTRHWFMERTIRSKMEE